MLRKEIDSSGLNGCNAGDSCEQDVPLEIPTFLDLWQKYWTNHDKPESFTTLLDIDHSKGVVTKAYLEQRLTEALQSNSVIPSPSKTGREADMLQLLNRLQLPAPRVLAFNKDRTAFAMELVSGDLLLDWMLTNGLTAIDVNRISFLAWEIHNALATSREEIATLFPAFPGHTGDVTNLLKETHQRVNSAIWAPDLDSGLKNIFQQLVEKLVVRFSNNAHYFHATDAIYGDFAINNIMRQSDGKLVLIDPIICVGRRSMDLGRLGRSIIVRDISAFNQNFEQIIAGYNSLSEKQLPMEEIIDMLCVDLLRIMTLFLNIPDNQLNNFPSYIYEVSRVQLELYLTKIVPKLLKYEI